MLGDRAYALVDVEDGTVASAKHPRKWGALLGLSARFVTEPVAASPIRVPVTVLNSTDTTGLAAKVAGAGPGAMIIALWPCSRRFSATRQTLVVTPLRLGRKDSVAMATRTLTNVARRRPSPVTVRWVSGEHQVTT